MVSELMVPDNPLMFIRNCVIERKVFWTHHINMRLNERNISRQAVWDSVEQFEIIESYQDDKYLPSYLILFRYKGTIIHILFATDVTNENVRVVTAYYPDPGKWDRDFRRRKQ